MNTMKPNSLRAWMVIAFLCFMANSLSAETSGPFTYEVDGDFITITGYQPQTDKEKAIPKTIKGKQVISIGDEAFAACRHLNKITIPANIVGIGVSAFRDCSNLTAINVDAHNPDYTSVDGVLFNKDQTTLIQCPGGKEGSITIPSSVTSIAEHAINNSPGLTEIKVDPNNTKYSSLDGVLFNKKLTKLIRCPSGKAGSVNIPANVISIGNYAFYHCHCLTSVNIPACVERIGWQAFAYCSDLTSVTIPKSVTSIGTSAFCNCSGLTRAFFAGKAPLMGTGVFGNTARGFTVYYHGENNNFTPPKWEGYAAEIIDESK